MPWALQCGGIERDPDLALGAAFAGDRGRRRDAEQRAGDGIVDVPAQLLELHLGGFGGDEHELAAVILAPADLRLQDAFGQVAADLGDGVAHIGDRAVERRADLERDHGLAVAFADVGC